MTARGTAWLGLMSIAGVLSAGVTIYGTAAAVGIDFRQNPVLVCLYCLLPFMAFPVFMLVKSARISAALLAIIACSYLAVYSALSWRTCSELGYCGTVRRPSGRFSVRASFSPISWPRPFVSLLCASTRKEFESHADDLPGELYQLLGLNSRSKDRNARNASPHHRDFVAAVKPRADLAILEDLVRQVSLVFDNPESVFEEEIRNTSKQAN